jgi:hypothetical protein
MLAPAPRHARHSKKASTHTPRHSKKASTDHMHNPPSTVPSLCRLNAPSNAEQHPQQPRRKAHSTLDFSSADAHHSVRCAIAVFDREDDGPLLGINTGPLRMRACRLSGSLLLRSETMLRRVASLAWRSLLGGMEVERDGQVWRIGRCEPARRSAVGAVAVCGAQVPSSAKLMVNRCAPGRLGSGAGVMRLGVGLDGAAGLVNDGDGGRVRGQRSGRVVGRRERTSPRTASSRALILP